jgi:hypothetical protein
MRWGLEWIGVRECIGWRLGGMDIPGFKVYCFSPAHFCGMQVWKSEVFGLQYDMIH